MFSFHWPWMGLLLLLPLLSALLWPRLRQEDRRQHEAGVRTTLHHPNLQRLQESFTGHRPGRAIAGPLHLLLLILLWSALTLTMMRPQWLEPHTELKSEGYDLLLAVDTSRSMTALDFSRDNRPISRMAVVKGVMGRFMDGRQGDRIGLVVFGDQAFTLSPLTLDIQAVQDILQGVEPGMAGPATAIGDAIGLGVKRLRERPAGSRILLLVTDGENTAGLLPPREAARMAATAGVRIYTIGVGSNQSEVPVLGSDGQYHQETEIGLDEETLRETASLTGGAYYRATHTQALEEIYQKIDALEKTEAERHTVFIPHPLYRWPLGIALLILLLLGLFPEGRIRSLGEPHG